MTGYALRLFTDRLPAGAGLPLPATGAHRVLYVAEGSASVAAGGTVVTLAPNSVWCGSLAAAVAAGAKRARILRYELAAGDASVTGAADADGIESLPTLSATFELDPTQPALLRCDRVSLPPGSVRHLHDQAGPGIRCLESGSFRVDMGGKSTTYRPGEAWFEAARDPVVAYGSMTETSRFIRVLVLPRAYLGRRSSRDLCDEGRGGGRPSTSEIFIDTPIAL